MTIQTGEMIVVRGKGGLAVGRCLTPPDRDSNSRVKIGVSRGRDRTLPRDRVVEATGVVVSGDAEADSFVRQCEALASRIDLSEVWEVAVGAAAPIGLDDIAELYWNGTPSPSQRVALLLHLERDTLHFSREAEDFSPRPPEQVAEMSERRRRKAENARQAEALMDALSRGLLADRISPYQRDLLDHLRGYTVHGDSYTRATVAREMLARTGRRGGDPQRAAFDLLTTVGLLDPDEPLELERAGIVEEFPAEVITEAASIDLDAALARSPREDLTSLAALTIDDAGTEDRDDALSVERVGDGMYRLGIHIADAAALVPSGGAMDGEADRRIASLYTPDRRVPMLPPEVSGGAGSLMAGERRGALSLIVEVTDEGEVEAWRILPSVVRSRAALTYDEADEAIRDGNGPWSGALTSMHCIADGLERKRKEKNAVTVDSPEMRITIADSGEVEVSVTARSTPARSTVMELMILCNSLLARYCRENRLPAAYRSQPTPDLTGLPDLPDGPFKRFQLFRRLQPASISTVPDSHGGLGVEEYIQATSPLRRYPDLVMQRQIGRHLRTGEARYSAEEVASVCHRADVQLRELSGIENERRRYWFLKYLRQQTGASDGEEPLFPAVVLENRPGRPALMELSDYPFRFRSRLPLDVQDGETVATRLKGVDLWRRVARLIHEPGAGSLPSPARGGG